MGIQMRNTLQYVTSAGITKKIINSPQVTINVVGVDELELNACV